MEIGLGVLHLAPRDFWDMTLTEFYAACEGLNQFHGGGSEKNGPMLRSELEELMELYPD